MAMKITKLIAAAMFAVVALAFAGRAGAGEGNNTARLVSAPPASHAAHHAGIAHRAGVNQRNRQFYGGFQSFPYYPYYGYGG